MQLWVTDEPWPTSAEVKAQALAAGATQTVHADQGIPIALADLIEPGTLGLVELPDPDPVPESDPEPVDNPEPVDEPVSEGALLLAAEQARRDAFDSVMASGPRSMKLLEDAQRAGSAAFSAILGS